MDFKRKYKNAFHDDELVNSSIKFSSITNKIKKSSWLKNDLKLSSDEEEASDVEMKLVNRTNLNNQLSKESNRKSSEKLNDKSIKRSINESSLKPTSSLFLNDLGKTSNQKMNQKMDANTQSTFIRNKLNDRSNCKLIEIIRNRSSINDAEDSLSETSIDAKKESNSFCNSEESIDLNDLKGYHDFNKNDLIEDSDYGSSSSSYCEMIDYSEDVKFDRDFGCVEMNIDLNEKQINPFNHSQIMTYRNKQNLNDKTNLTIRREDPRKYNYEYVQANYQQPWIDDGKIYSGIMGLHEEINDFYEYSRLKPEEIRVRNFVFLQVKELILNKWPDAQVFVFGSYQTNLSLPMADLDIVVFNGEKKIPFYSIESQLVNEDIARYDDIKIISKASVPIIKFIQKYNGINVDISFNCNDGPRAIQMIKSFIEYYPSLPKLLLFLKLFLHQRKLNLAYTGGLSSYSLTLMVISFYQHHPCKEIVNQKKDVNLGVLLMEFLEYYAVQFNHKKFAIRVSNGGKLIRKDSNEFLRKLEPYKNRMCIEDPIDSTNNPTKNSLLYEKIKSSFKNAFNQLNSRLIYPQSNKNKSLIGDVVGYTLDEVELREKVLKFHEKKFENYGSIVVKHSFDYSSDFIPFSLFTNSYTSD